MVFHVACPITCRRICFCSLGLLGNLHGRRDKDVFLKEIRSLEPLVVGVSIQSTVQVRVPKVAHAAPHTAPSDGSARRSASADVPVSSKDFDGEDHDHSSPSTTCHLCSLVETEGSERATRMLSCKSCCNKYHRSCLKSWAQHRDLFHWSSWTCPSCRTCEVCGTSRDPRKFMFCKRCDAAYHCSCQQPQHKNVSTGPYVCPKHTKCHSCGSTVPGNGLSVRWFLGYTCCDACGRLFVKGNYCPVCLKVYRDSESTPMVCCDICQRWVHCQCDGISDEKYLQFQVDGNLSYKCATCRGECYQVKDLEDAVRELWKRKDMADRELIASLRAAAGLSIEEEISSLYPSSDDEKDGFVVGRNMKSAVKGLADKSQKYISSAKKHSKKKVFQASIISTKSEVRLDSGGHNDVRSNGYGLDRAMQDNPSRSARLFGHSEGSPPIDQPCFLENKVAGEVKVSGEEDNKLSRVLRIKCSRRHDSDSESPGKHDTELNMLKAKRLVINIGQQKVKVAEPLSSDASKLLKQQELVSKGHGLDHSGTIRSLKVSGKFGKLQSEETVFPEQHPVMLGKNNEDRSWSEADMTSLKGEEGFGGRHLEGRGDLHCKGKDDSDDIPALQKDSRPLLKFRIKKRNPENQESEAPIYVDERGNSRKGHRSRRKRPSTLLEKSYFNEDEDASLAREDSLLDEMLDASWILKKLGEDAKGKRVQIHQASDNSWQKGVVSEVAGGASKLWVTLDNGRVKKVELGKQGVRFVPQKQKRTRA